MSEKEGIRAKITSPAQGQQGHKYFVTQILEGERGYREVGKGNTVTFSLDVWGDKENHPKMGQLVRLYDVMEYSRGWRANKAEPIKL